MTFPKSNIDDKNYTLISNYTVVSKVWIFLQLNIRIRFVLLRSICGNILEISNEDGKSTLQARNSIQANEAGA